MPSEVEFDCVVMRTEEYIGQMGDSVIEPIAERGRTIGFLAERSSYTYQVVGDPDTEFLQISFPYSLVNQLSGLIDEEDAIEILSGDDESVEEADSDLLSDVSDDELLRLAAKEALDRVSEDVREAFVYHLVVILSAGSAAYSLQSTEEGMVSGFTVSAKAFPYEPGFGLREFDDRVQAVVNTGIGGLIFINQSFDFQSMIAATEISSMLPRYIH